MAKPQSSANSCGVTLGPIKKVRRLRPWPPAETGTGSPRSASDAAAPANAARRRTGRERQGSGRGLAGSGAVSLLRGAKRQVRGACAWAHRREAQGLLSLGSLLFLARCGSPASCTPRSKPGRLHPDIESVPPKIAMRCNATNLQPGQPSHPACPNRRASSESGAFPGAAGMSLPRRTISHPHSLAGWGKSYS